MKTLLLIIVKLKSIITRKFLSKKKLSTEHTNHSRYCYSVWLRHFINRGKLDLNPPKIVAELGPGDSLGTGFAALLSGCEKIYFFDVVERYSNENNLKVFDELVEFFKKRENVPNEKEFPNVSPKLEKYEFPSNLLSESILSESLNLDRISLIRDEIADINNPNNKFIKLQVPWYDSNILEKKSVDFIYSQAVLQHVEDLENTYGAMSAWLKPSGYMSHSIDFKSMGTAKKWNGHWTYSDLQWKIIKGRQVYLINREPLSSHLHLHTSLGFDILEKSLVTKENRLSKKQLSKKFEHLSDEDLTTSEMYIFSKKT